MRNFYLGAVERVSPLGKPAARVRPIAEASADKTRWLPTNGDFPNSGVVSWWAIPKDLRKGGFWVFQLEESATFEANKPQHDEFKVVESTAHSATQVITVSDAKDDEDTRRAIAEGFSLDSCIAKQAFVASPAGYFIGPFRLIYGDTRVDVDPSDLEAPIDVFELRSAGECFVKDRIQVLPAAAQQTIFKKIGDLDFSSDSVFIKRAIKNLKQVEPDTLKEAKLTNQLMDESIRAFGAKQLSIAQRHRIVRLSALAASGRKDIQLTDHFVSDILGWAPVRSEIEVAKKEAIDKALQEKKSAIEDLKNAAHQLESKRDTLRTEIKALEEEIATERKSQEAALHEFKGAVTRKLQSVAKDSAAFLSDISLFKVALGVLEGGKHTQQTEGRPVPVTAPTGNLLAKDLVVANLQSRVAGTGLDWWTCGPLVSSLAAGFLPILHGPQFRDYLTTVASSLAANRLFWLPLNAAQLTVEDLASAVVTSDEPSYDGASMTLRSLLEHARNTDRLCILCLEGVNLCQADALLMPVLRRWARLQNVVWTGSDERSEIMTPVGSWPTNLLVVGLIADSSLALPVSNSIWELASYVSAPFVFNPALPAYKLDRRDVPAIGDVSVSEWAAFKREIEKQAISPSSLPAVAWTVNSRCSREFTLRTTALSKTLSRFMPDVSDDYRSLLGLAVSVVPYAVANDVDATRLIEGIRSKLPQIDDFAQKCKEVFSSWGIGRS